MGAYPASGLFYRSWSTPSIPSFPVNFLISFRLLPDQPVQLLHPQQLHRRLVIGELPAAGMIQDGPIPDGRQQVLQLGIPDGLAVLSQAGL